MARRVADITIDAEGRDKGKVFRLTEMPASAAERWAIRAFLAIAKSGLDIPDNLKENGMAGLAQFGIQALAAIEYDELAPLLDEMFTYIKIVPDPRNANPDRANVVRALNDDDIDEVTTRLRLRKEMFFLHTDFSPPVVPSI